MLHGHGDDIYEQELQANFSSNVPQIDCDSQLTDFWLSKLNMLKSYPEANAESFVECLATKYNLQPSQICATHGATEAIYLVAQAFAGKCSAILSPSFAEYEDACRINRHRLYFFKDVEKCLEIGSNLIWLCNPNNPTGKALDKNLLLQIVDSKTDSVFVIDQTYRYFTKKETISYAEAINRPNLILIDSLTKRYAVPGLRLGYLVANNKLVKVIGDIKPPWSVNQLAIETGKYLLKNQGLLPLNLSCLLSEKEQLQAEIKVLPNIKVYPTDTHFFLCELSSIVAKTCKAYLLEKHKLLIRNADNFRGLSPYFIRISTQKRNPNKQLVEALSVLLNNLTN